MYTHFSAFTLIIHFLREYLAIYLPRIELHWIDIFEYFLTDIDYFPSTPMLTPIDASGFLVRLWIRVKSVVINRVSVNIDVRVATSWSQVTSWKYRRRIVTRAGPPRCQDNQGSYLLMTSQTSLLHDATRPETAYDLTNSSRMADARVNLLIFLIDFNQFLSLFL